MSLKKNRIDIVPGGGEIQTSAPNKIDSIMATHSSTYKGKRVQVILIDGTSFVDKFVDSKSTLIEFEEHGKISKKDIRSFSIWRG